MPYRTPIAHLAQAWEIKLFLATAGAVVIELLTHLAGLYERMLSVDPLLVLVAATLLLVDAVTGIGAAVKAGTPITSRRWRRTGWKFLEYSALGFVGIAIANAFSASPFHYVTDGFDDAVLLYIALTEAFSVVENVTGSREGAQRLIRRITDLATGRTRTVSEVITRPPDAPTRGAPTRGSEEEPPPGGNALPLVPPGPIMDDASSIPGEAPDA